MNERKSFYLIDGSSYIYRAFYALGHLSNAKGMPTQAVYGFAQMLIKVLREKAPDYVCVVFDAPGPSFRHQVYEDYKATRQKMPEDMAIQIPYIKDLVKYHGIAQVELESYEADDLIAQMARWGSTQGLEVVIVSADKDLHQLIRDPQVVQWDPQRDRVFTEAAVVDRFGVPPDRMKDYLALVGDSTDNVPGVKGVGDKTARQLLQRWGSLDDVYANLDEVSPPSVRKKLELHRDDAYLSRDLVSLREDAPLELALREFAPASRLKRELAGLYEDLDFKKLLDILRQEGGEDISKDMSVAEENKEPRNDSIITSPDELSDLARRMESERLLSINLITTSRDPMRADLAGIAVCFEDRSACYIPILVEHQESVGQPGFTVSRVLSALKRSLGDGSIKKVGHNLKHGWVVLKNNGVDLRGMEFDAMVASYLLDPGKRDHELDRIASEHLGESVRSFADAAGSGKQRAGGDELDVPKAAGYACESAEAALRVVPVLRKSLGESGMGELFASLEMPLVEVLARMEHRGILVDGGELESLSLDFEKAMDQKTGMIFDMAKEEFNIQSPKQLAYILFEKLGLRVIKTTKTGPSTDVSVLEELAGEHPIVEQVLSYRSLAKLKGTYLDALPRLIHPETGRIHTSYNQTVAATGRLSSSDPNLQNIPIRTEEGRRIRRAFVAEPGHVFLSADYSQIELRILAHYSQDEHLLEAFEAGDDIHRRTAAEMLGIPPHGVTPEMRRQAKMINFGIIYGMGAFGLAQRLKISNKVAKGAIDRYFDRYKGVKRFIDATIETARERGYCESFLGRRRAIPELKSRNRAVRQQGERLAINTPIQSTAADLIKKAMVDIDKELGEKTLRTAMLLQVHDELVFEVPLAELDAVKELVRQKMESVWQLSVPLKVDMGWGENWAAAHR